MIVLRCSRCEREIEVFEPLSNQTVLCPKCGQLLAKGQRAGAGSGLEGGNVNETVTAEAQNSGGDTDIKSFPFLTAPRDGSELGWLGRYRVARLLGKGGMAMVFGALDTTLGRPVALKVMKPEISQDALAVQRFLREARAMAAFRNDHIVTIYEVDQAGSHPFLAMELLEGEPLDAWLKHERPAPAEIIDFSLQIARGLAAAHQSGMIHRDIKPANIWVEEPRRRLKVLDFGLARHSQQDSHLTHTGAVVGTPAYMAPEQADGQPVDERCDLFSLGCVLYELASGQQAFVGTSTIGILKAVALTEPRPLGELNPAMPAAFYDLVKRLLAKDPKQRPESAQLVVETLEAIAAGRAPQVRPEDAGDFGRSPPIRLKSAWVLGGALGCVLVGGLMLWMFGGPFFGRERDQPAAPAAPVRGVTAREVVLGMSAPFSGPAREAGRVLQVGIDTFLQHVNDEGGIAGRKLRLVALDDRYEPERALANMKELFDQRNVFAVIGNVGSDAAEKTLPYALEKRLLFFEPLSGASLVRKVPPDRYVFNFRPGFDEETTALFKFLVEVKGVRPEQIAIFAEHGAYGEAAVRGLVKMLRKSGSDPEKLLRLGYARNTLAVEDAVEKILRAPDIRAVIMAALYQPAARFIEKVKNGRKAAAATNGLLFAHVSSVGINARVEELSQLGGNYIDGLIISQVVPAIDSQATAVMKYRDLLSKYHPNEPPSFSSLEGYIDAMIFTEGLRRAGANLTAESLIEALESIRNLDLGIGTPISFGPSEHQASHKVWGTVLNKSGNYQSLELE
jgi:ABC-type branched-subunit amino acid transport system substrate-binding protein